MHRFTNKAKRLGVELRAHVKTHKCIDAARLQVAGHFGGITVSTLAEARFFADAGFRDIVYAVPIAPHRLDDALDLAARVAQFAVLVDHHEVAESAAAAARERGVVLGIFLEVDCGGGRSGVDPEDENSLSLAHRIQTAPNLELRGLLTHAGHAYSCRTWSEVEQVAEQERAIIVDFARRLRENEIDPGTISIGSTPTFAAVEDLDFIDEVRPGNYAFFDAFQCALGSCTHEDVAFSVLATVIGHYPQRSSSSLIPGPSPSAKISARSTSIPTAASGSSPHSTAARSPA